MKSLHARILSERLRPLTLLDATTLSRVAGGEFASTSTSGTPDAGDDTIGDQGGGGLGGGVIRVQPKGK